MKISIDQEWYDLKKWAQHHPGGETILQAFDGHDATAHFYSLHSRDAISKLKRMAPVDVKEPAPELDPLDVAFAELKAKLEKEGWWKRNVAWEAFLLLSVFGLCLGGTYLSYSHPWTASFLIALGMQQAGWLGHDMVHARNSVYCEKMSMLVSGWVNGFNRDWWSDKHNTHHVLTNHIEFDPDIHNEPLIFNFAPLKALDAAYRKFQVYYFVPLYFLLYVAWRSHSLQWAIREKQWSRLAFVIAPSYIWLACLPVAVTIGSLLLGGFFVAIVVTLSHESEEMWKVGDREPSFVKNQFASTSDIITPDPISEYFFGGMQYQLIHHLVPTLPRYYYRQLVPVITKFAKDHGLEYKRGSLKSMYAQHIATLHHNAIVEAL